MVPLLFRHDPLDSKRTRITRKKGIREKGKKGTVERNSRVLYLAHNSGVGGWIRFFYVRGNHHADFRLTIVRVFVCNEWTVEFDKLCDEITRVDITTPYAFSGSPGNENRVSRDCTTPIGRPDPVYRRLGPPVVTRVCGPHNNPMCPCVTRLEEVFLTPDCVRARMRVCVCVLLRKKKTY